MGDLKIIAETALQWQGRPADEGDRKQQPSDIEVLPFHITREGLWFYRDSLISRRELVNLFAGVLQRGEDGSYLLETPTERGMISVDDAPFLVVDMSVNDREGSQAITFRTNVNDIVDVDDDHPVYIRERSVYLKVRAGKSPRYSVEARLSERVIKKLSSIVVNYRMHMGIWSKNIFFQLPGNFPEGKPGLYNPSLYHQEPTVTTTPEDMLAPATVEEITGIEETAAQLIDASRKAVRTADRLLEVARQDNDTIASFNEGFVARLAEIDAQPTTW